jgi:tetratricopeptide (TPR) repeat protein
VVREIAAAIPGRVDVGEIARMLRRPAESPTAYDLLLRGEHLRHQDWGSAEAKLLFEQAIEADPRCARAFAHLANWHAYGILAHMTPIAEGQRLTKKFADKALLLEPNDPAMLALIAEGYIMVGELASARRCIEKAIKLNPNHYMVMLYASVVLAWLGDTDASLLWLQCFQRHDPLSVEAAREASFEVYFLNQRFAEAIEATVGWINAPAHMLAEIAAAYGHLGKMEEAAAYRQRFEAERPLASSFRDYIEAQMLFCGTDAIRELWLTGYRQAGFDCG